MFKLKHENMKTRLYTYVSFGTLAGIIVLTLGLIVSCSKSNPGAGTTTPDEVTEQKLVLTASSAEAIVGKEVTFTVKSGNTTVEADIFVGGTKIAGNTHKFKDIGTYSVIAMKEGYKASEKMEIKVVYPLSKKTAKLTFNKVNMAPYTPAFGDRGGKACMNQRYIYVSNNTTYAFKRYDLKNNKWENLIPSEHLIDAGGQMGGLMVCVNEGLMSGTVFFQNEMQHAYLPPEFGVPGRRNTWSSVPVDSWIAQRERGAVAYGKDIYYFGNRIGNSNSDSKRIHRYSTDIHKWEFVGELPVAASWGAQGAVFDKKIYILTPIYNAQDALEFHFFEFDPEAVTIRKIPSHPAMRYIFSKNNQSIAAYKDYILHTDGSTIFIYDVAEEQWLEKTIDHSDWFDTAQFTALISPSTDKLYFAGTKNNNFILYELNMEVTK